MCCYYHVLKGFAFAFDSSLRYENMIMGPAKLGGLSIIVCVGVAVK